MWNAFASWTWGVVEHYRRDALVSKLDRLSDHLLEDIGLRRDELDLLRLPSAKVRAKKVGFVPSRAGRPSLQGCGWLEDTLPFAEAARCLAELGHPHRLQIFNMLVNAGEAGCKVSDLQQALALPKSTLSHHLAELVATGLVTQTREGRVLRCRIDARRARLVQKFVNQCCEGLPTE
jgi:ArsR family transcriptional regulator